MKIAIIIPAYNEELTIDKVIREFHDARKDARIYVIDNNSKDKTNAIAKKTLDELGCGEVIFEGRQGKANAIKKAFSFISADIYVIVDADLTYPAEELDKLILPVMEKRADMVVGDRLTNGRYFSENKRKFHNFGNVLVKKIINFLFKSELKDIMSGYRVFSRRFVKHLPILTGGFELETEMTLHALNKSFSIVEIPIEYKDRIEGSSSKLRTFSDGFKVIKTIIRIFKNIKPLAFFGFIAFIFFAGGVASGIPVIQEFIKFRYIYKVPSAILASAFMIIAMLCYSIGLILSTVVHHFNIDFEIMLAKYDEENERKN